MSWFESLKHSNLRRPSGCGGSGDDVHLLLATLKKQVKAENDHPYLV